jgi:hypothetical protein
MDHSHAPAMIIRNIKHVRRQRDDDSQNKLLQINYCEEELLSSIIHSACVYELSSV